MVNAKIKILNEKAKVPARATNGAAGYDVVAVSERFDMIHNFVEYGLGFSIEVPEGYEAVIRPRSSISDKDQLLINSPATIDSDYRGEIKLRFKPLRMPARKYKVGDAIAQILIQKVENVQFEVVTEELTSTARDTGSFGSTSIEEEGQGA